MYRIKNLYLRIDFRQLRIRTRSLRNKALYILTLIKLSVARFMGTGGFLDILTVTRNKRYAN